MTDNKFTTMMLRKENLCEQAAVEHESDGYDALASAARDEASDWRAMRKAWEALVEAITQLCDDADEYDLLRDYVTVDRVLYENLTAALAKARGE